MSKQPIDPNTSQIHHDSLLDEELWIQKADQLLDAAELLSPHVDAAWSKKGGEHIIDIHAMLVAFAIENLLKAYIVKTQSSRVSSEVKAPRSSGKRRPCIFSHNIKGLIRTAGMTDFDADPNWAFLFDRLTHLAVWSGRYPTATAANGFGLEVETSLGDKYIVTHLRNDADRDNMRRVVACLKGKLRMKAEPTVGGAIRAALQS